MFPRQYSPQRIEISHGKGIYLFDNTGKRYIDFAAGISVNSFGYGDAKFAQIAATQIEKLIHISNLFVTQPAKKLAKRLLEFFPSMACVHFGNSGTEAIESAIKYARFYTHGNKSPERTKLIAFENGFHGRTLGAASLNGAAAKNKLLSPLIPHCLQLPYNDGTAMRRHIDAHCAAVFIEPVQGEGGLERLTKENAMLLQELCAEHDVLIVADEIQTGLGRLGALTGSEILGLDPDMIALSKPLAAGLPLSALLISERVNACIPFAAHGTTFGGGPVSCSLALEVLDRITAPSFFPKVQKSAQHLHKALQHIISRHHGKLVLKGTGMLCGLKLAAPFAEFRAAIIERAAAEGLLILPSGNDVLRIAPPLIISTEEIDAGIEILQSAIDTYLL